MCSKQLGRDAFQFTKFSTHRKKPRQFANYAEYEPRAERDQLAEPAACWTDGKRKYDDTLSDSALSAYNTSWQKLKMKILTTRAGFHQARWWGNDAQVNGIFKIGTLLQQCSESKFHWPSTTGEQHQQRKLNSINNQRSKLHNSSTPTMLILAETQVFELFEDLKQKRLVFHRQLS